MIRFSNYVWHLKSHSRCIGSLGIVLEAQQVSGVLLDVLICYIFGILCACCILHLVMV